ncbi:unnamed protein product, partial [Prorocentrum cordatum]
PVALLSTVDMQPAFYVDFLAEPTQQVLNVLRANGGGSMTAGQVRRSAGYTDKQPRAMELMFRQMRLLFPAGTVRGSQSLFAGPSTLLVEIGHACAAFCAWPLCSGILFLSSERLLVVRDASEGTSTSAMDQAIKDDPEG